VEVDSVAVKSIGNGLSEVTAVVTNRRLVPTHTQQDLENNITAPDLVTLTGAQVISGYRVTNTRTGESVEQERDPSTIQLRNIAGHDFETLKWIVRGAGPVTVTVKSVKGGSHSLSSKR
ncbi:MAG: peptidase M14, partial [Gemmatimonadota bacterium]